MDDMILKVEERRRRRRRRRRLLVFFFFFFFFFLVVLEVCLGFVVFGSFKFGRIYRPCMLWPRAMAAL